MRRPIVISTLEFMIFRGLKKREQKGPGHAFMALHQLGGMFKETEAALDVSRSKNEKYKRLRQAHLNMINKLKEKIDVLEKEIEFVKEQRSPTPECYTVDKPNHDPNGFEENDLARAIQTGGFQIPRF